jgi:hypothetical protein
MLAADGERRNAKNQRSLRGKPIPRIAPPIPARSQVAEFEAQARDIGISLFPSQKTAARYLEALGPRDRYLYREVAIIIGRQNGKTEILKPLIVRRLRKGYRIAHTAQNRELPREVFMTIAEVMLEKYPKELKTKPRYANGQEEIRLRNGGVYRIVAPTPHGARGGHNDLVIIDELREMDDWGFIDAAKPTTITRVHGQVVYLSNAGTDTSIVLNTLRKRAETDPSLAYLEWSAAPERAPDDVEGWCEANPAIGHLPELLPSLEREYLSATLGETMPSFETEHLCRWVHTLAKPLVDPKLWAAAEGVTGDPVHPVLALALNQPASRASAAIAWPTATGVGVQVVADVTGDPIDLEVFGLDLARLARSLRVWRVVFDPYSEPLVRYLRRPNEREKSARLHKVTGEEFATSSTSFVRLLEGGKLTWSGELGRAVGTDLGLTTKRSVAPGVFVAVPSNPDQPITAALAVIRAAGAVAGPRPLPPQMF